MQDIFTFMQHHETLSLALGVVLTLLIIVEFLKQKSSSARLTPSEAITLINRENAVVIDIRSKEIFATGHISESISLPLKDLEKNLKKIEKYKSQPIIIVCSLGNDSLKAEHILKQNGFNARVLNNGLNSWTREQLPLVKN